MQRERTKHTNRFRIMGGLLALAVLVVFAGCQNANQNQAQGSQSGSQATAEDPVKRGEYLVTVLACNDCHTPFKKGPNGPEPDMSKMLSGHPADVKMPPPPKLAPDAAWNWAGSATNTAFTGPWGVSYSTNLTPHEQTGIGAWTEAIFIQTIRSGKHWGAARPILPPMPWMAYKDLTDGDLKAIFAYLKSIPPIDNQVPPSEPAAPPPGTGNAPKAEGSVPTTGNPPNADSSNAGSGTPAAESRTSPPSPAAAGASTTQPK